MKNVSPIICGKRVSPSSFKRRVLETYKVGVGRADLEGVARGVVSEREAGDDEGRRDGVGEDMHDLPRRGDR